MPTSPVSALRRPRSSARIDLLEGRRLFAASYLVPTDNAEGSVFDATRNRLYVMADSSILRFDLNTKQQLPTWTGVGTDLDGGDVTPDGKWLYVADENSTYDDALHCFTVVHKVDLATGKVVKDLLHEADFNSSASSVVITSDNRAMVRVMGNFTPVEVFDLGTDRSIPSEELNIYSGFMYRGKDRSSVVVSDFLSPPTSYVRDSRTHKWTQTDWMGGVGEVVISPDGNEVASAIAYYNRSLKKLRSHGYANALGYESDGSLLYSFEPGDTPPGSLPVAGTVVARDHLTEVKEFSFKVDADVFGTTPRMSAVSDDGRWLVMLGWKGARLYDLSPYKPATGSIAGTVFNDADSNGVRGSTSAEPGLAGVKLYLDKNGNGKFDTGEVTVVTDSSGNYKFNGLAAGAGYCIRQLIPNGYGVKSPAIQYYTVPLTAGAAVTGKAFADAKLGSIAGTLINDANRNLARDAGDAALSAWTVYIDANNNGKLDANESRTLTDSNGSWKFGGLFAGDYVMRAVATAGMTVVTPTGTGTHVKLSPGQNVGGKLITARKL